MTQNGVHRPSEARRKALNAEISLPSVSNFFPIERYYDAAQTLYESFLQTNRDDSQLDLCYLYGKRYCMFVLEAIPEHNYHNTPKYKGLHKQHTVQVTKVLDLLESVVTRMDKDCLEQQRQATIRAERERLEKERIQQKQFEEWQQRIQLQKKKTPTPSSSSDVQQSALDKLKLLQGDTGGQEIATGVPISSRKRSSTRYGLIDDSDTDDELPSIPSTNGMPLPPPMLPPTSEEEEDKKEDELEAPPSYQAVVRTHKYHPFFGPAEHKDASSLQIRPPGPPEEEPSMPQFQQKPEKPKPMRQLQDIYRTNYQQYQRQGKIQILQLDTYQGRVSESTNGCTVISALIAARHMNSSSLTSISDATIKAVIDQQCGPYLREIRRKLGLSGHALIIPSDVHDHLVDAKILQQDYFAGAAGGNIMDPQHYGEFLKLLAETKPNGNGKAAATLFFREHVISIVRFPTGPQQFSFDLIDSLMGSNGRATRTRCVDSDALQVLLQWYASRKFSDSNCKYIDRNPWDDTMADLDPRVFQGFVWST